MGVQAACSVVYGKHRLRDLWQALTTTITITTTATTTTTTTITYSSITTTKRHSSQG